MMTSSFVLLFFVLAAFAAPSVVADGAFRTTHINNDNKVNYYDDVVVHVLVYETEMDEKHSGDMVGPAQQIVDQINNSNRISKSRSHDRESSKGTIIGKVFGRGSKYNGFGSKFSAVLPLLYQMKDDAGSSSSKNRDTLVVLSDGRDVLVNIPYTNVYNDNDSRHESLGSRGVIDVSEFWLSYKELTRDRPDSIVISAEAQCCVSALTHASPGSYYNRDGSRNMKACSSGSADCLWVSDDRAEPWEYFMEELMLNRTRRDTTPRYGNSNYKKRQDRQVLLYDDMYLNAGLIVGKVDDLIRVLTSAQIFDDEDDQAVLTDFMYNNPNDIVLDYGQILFGNNRGGLANFHMDHGCTFHTKKMRENDGDTSINEDGGVDGRLYHSITGTAPLFVHSPGGFYQCHDHLSELLGIPSLEETTEGVESTLVLLRRRRLLNTQKRQLSSIPLCNYGRSGCSETEGEETEAEAEGRLANFLNRFRTKMDGEDDEEDQGEEEKMTLLDRFKALRDRDDSTGGFV